MNSSYPSQPPTVSSTAPYLDTSTMTLDFQNISESELRSPLVIGLCSVIFLAILLATIIGNVVVIAAIVNYRTLKSSRSNLYILNLAIADLAVALTVMIWTAAAFVLDMGQSVDHPWMLGMVSSDLYLNLSSPFGFDSSLTFNSCKSNCA